MIGDGGDDGKDELGLLGWEKLEENQIEYLSVTLSTTATNDEAATC